MAKNTYKEPFLLIMSSPTCDLDNREKKQYWTPSLKLFPWYLSQMTLKTSWKLEEKDKNGLKS